MLATPLDVRSYSLYQTFLSASCDAFTLQNLTSGTPPGTNWLIGGWTIQNNASGLLLREDDVPCPLRGDILHRHGDYAAVLGQYSIFV